MKSEATEGLFNEIFGASTEEELFEVLTCVCGSPIDSLDWWPLDNNESNFGVIENQQSSPIAALIEKITNSIDAILMRKCYEAGIDPKSRDAPKSMENAVAAFFHPENETWCLSPARQKQSE